ncbi:MAG: hypothetical protein C5B49_07100 [Bdellovibrio sp.]|nr:MAG: hypothetical protein C5B49_07100 [Bdellovibrio sp.]
MFYFCEGRCQELGQSGETGAFDRSSKHLETGSFPFVLLNHFTSQSGSAVSSEENIFFSCYQFSP